MIHQLDERYYLVLALRTSIYHSISHEVYNEVGRRLPTLYILYIEGYINNKDVKAFIKRDGKIW